MLFKEEREPPSFAVDPLAGGKGSGRVGDPIYNPGYLDIQITFHRNSCPSPDSTGFYLLEIHVFHLFLDPIEIQIRIHAY